MTGMRTTLRSLRNRMWIDRIPRQLAYRRGSRRSPFAPRISGIGTPRGTGRDRMSQAGYNPAEACS